VTFTAFEQCQEGGTCDPQAGQRSNPGKSDGTACDLDSDLCTQDTCQSGTCSAGGSVTCTASDQCHDGGTCDPQTGQCSNPAKSDGTACDLDSDLCTQDSWEARR